MQATLGITTGDPAGIGLEIIFKSISPFLPYARFVLFTDRHTFERNAAVFHPPQNVLWIDDLHQLTDESTLFLKHVQTDSSTIRWGEASDASGRCAMAYLSAASDAALNHELTAIVTAPVSKAAVGRDFRGQTDFLADRAHTAKFAMAFFAPTLKVVLATIHLSLRGALAEISTDLYVELIRFTDRELRRFGYDRRRIAVAAINPHAGEGGIFGREDIEILRPAVEQCAGEGISVSGPHSADSLYYRAHSGEFDVVIAPYHDQGLIPVKLIAHGEATNVTLGLPYVRTSPDHGTAFDIAGKGVAESSGMAAAIKCALDLLRRGAKENGPTNE
jgi:4-hydroxythreonine-4-phosphate dehydrogenase